MDLKALGAAIALSLLAAVPAAAAPPDRVAARHAIAAYDAGRWRYTGVTDTTPLEGTLLVSFNRAADGRLSGEALVLDDRSRLLASGPLTGRDSGSDCHVAVDFGDVTWRLAGTCAPGVLAGQTSLAPPTPGFLARLVGWWGDRGVPGEAWLVPGGPLPPSRLDGRET